LYPLLEPEFGIVFSKAYYARIGHTPRRLYGRVMRLFVTPLLISLIDLFGYRDYLRYLSAFRYPLSGEFALTRELALNIRIPGNWGLEIGLLAEVYRNVAPRRITQIDLGTFDHKHQSLGDSDHAGLHNMCRDILHSLLQTLTEAEQVVMTKEHIHALRIKFRQVAQDLTQQYMIDARINHLSYDRHQEEVTIERFAQVIGQVGDTYFLDPAESEIPTWSRALAIIPDLREQLLETANQPTNLVAMAATISSPG
jgi:glucosyl-3-phosphoglycerate synthase